MAAGSLKPEFKIQLENEWSGSLSGSFLASLISGSSHTRWSSVHNTCTSLPVIISRKRQQLYFRQIITQHPVFQIFHVLVIAAAFVHYHGMANMAVYRWISSVNMVKWQSPQADKSWPVLCERDRAPCCGRHLASLWVFPSCRGFCDVMLWTVEQWTIANFALVQGPSRTMQFKWVWNSRDIFF